jgi:hypothetical protein
MNCVSVSHPFGCDFDLDAHVTRLILKRSKEYPLEKKPKKPRFDSSQYFLKNTHLLLTNLSLMVPKDLLQNNASHLTVSFHSRLKQSFLKIYFKTQDLSLGPLRRYLFERDVCFSEILQYLRSITFLSLLQILLIAPYAATQLRDKSIESLRKITHMTPNFKQS